MTRRKECAVTQLTLFLVFNEFLLVVLVCFILLDVGKLKVGLRQR